jgi:hypothetical protein
MWHQDARRAVVIANPRSGHRNMAFDEGFGNDKKIAKQIGA